MNTEAQIKIRHEHGLHARPADMFVRTANRYQANIFAYNLTRNAEKRVNAKSILGILSIGVRSGDEIRIEADGQDGSEAIAALTQLIDTNFED